MSGMYNDGHLYLFTETVAGSQPPFVIYDFFCPDHVSAYAIHVAFFGIQTFQQLC